MAWNDSNARLDNSCAQEKRLTSTPCIGHRPCQREAGKSYSIGDSGTPVIESARDLLCDGGDVKVVLLSRGLGVSMLMYVY